MRVLRLRLPALLPLLLLLSPVVLSGTGTLQFEQTRRAVSMSLGQTELVEHFRFVVAGDTPVAVLGASTSCGCTLPDLETRTYAPGETGTVTVRYRPGLRTGRQSVRVLVRTDSPDLPDIELLLEVDIPQPIVISPRMIFWGLNEPPIPKTIDITLRTSEPRRIVSAAAANNDFTVAVEEVEPGVHYRLHVTPRATDERYRAMIRWEFDGPWEGTPPSAYALIR